MIERWRPVVGYEGKYEVSSKGRVRSLDRRILTKASRRRSAHWRSYKGQLLRPGVFDEFGHVSVVLHHGASGTPVHHLVVRAFLGERPSRMDIRHKNGVGGDNRVENLEYSTRSKNNEDFFYHGRRKLTVESRKALLRDHAAGFSQSYLSKKYGICRSQVGNVVHKRHYKHAD